MTLKGHYALCFRTRLSEPTTNILMKIDAYYHRRICSPVTVDSGNCADIRDGSQHVCKFSLDLRMPASIYDTGMVCRTRFQDHVFGWWHLATNRATANTSTHVTRGDVGSGVADCDPQNVWNPRKNSGCFVDATSSNLPNKANVSI